MWRSSTHTQSIPVATQLPTETRDYHRVDVTVLSHHCCIQSSHREHITNMAPGITEISSTAGMYLFVTESRSSADAPEFDGIVRSLAPNQLLVIDFHAVWCGPCHAIAPVFANLANQYKHVKFVVSSTRTLRPSPPYLIPLHAHDSR